VRGIAFTQLHLADVVRHPLVARIVEAYDPARPAAHEKSEGRDPRPAPATDQPMTRSKSDCRTCKPGRPTLSLQFADASHRALLPRHRVARWLRHALEAPARSPCASSATARGGNSTATYRARTTPPTC
jgi:hypothetical protein